MQLMLAEPTQHYALIKKSVFLQLLIMDLIALLGHRVGLSSLEKPKNEACPAA